MLGWRRKSPAPTITWDPDDLNTVCAKSRHPTTVLLKVFLESRTASLNSMLLAIYCGSEFKSRIAIKLPASHWAPFLLTFAFKMFVIGYIPPIRITCGNPFVNELQILQHRISGMSFEIMICNSSCLSLRRPTSRPVNEILHAPNLRSCIAVKKQLYPIWSCWTFIITETTSFIMEQITRYAVSEDQAFYPVT